LFHSDVPDSILATVSFRHFGVAFDKNSFHWCSRLAEPGEYTAEAISLVPVDVLEVVTFLMLCLTPKRRSPPWCRLIHWREPEQNLVPGARGGHLSVAD